MIILMRFFSISQLKSLRLRLLHFAFLCSVLLPLQGLLAQTRVLYYASPFTGTDSLAVMDASNANELDFTSPILAGFTITGTNSITAHPTTGELWAVVKVSGGPRRLVRIDPDTFALTDVGSLGNNFSSIAFNSDGSILYGVTGDGASPSETLFSINQSTAATTQLCTLGNGADGEVIAWNDDEGKLYHWSGNGTVIMEKIDSTAGPNCAVTNVATGIGSGEVFGAVYDTTQNLFYLTNISSQLRTILPDGTNYTLIGSPTFNGMGDDARGLGLRFLPEMTVTGNSVAIASGDSSPDTADHTDFGNVRADSSSFSRTFTVANSGLAGLNLTGDPRISITGANAADFVVTSVPGTPISDGGTSDFIIQFSPSALGLRTATVEIANNDYDEGLYAFSIQGTGVVFPEMNVTGDSVSISDGDSTPSLSDDTDFGNVNVGLNSVNTFTIENSGGEQLLLDGTPKVVVSGTNAADFVVSLEPNSPVAASGTTTFQITFTPGAVGLRTADLSIANDDADEDPYNFSIQGTGIAVPEMSVLGNGIEIADGDASPTSTDYTDFGVASTIGAAVRTLTISNTGNASLNLTGTPRVSISGANAADFTVNLQPDATIAASGGSFFQIVFVPGALGLRTATVSIANDDSNENPYDFSIQGTGESDNDLDGTPDSLDLDDDNDGISDSQEGTDGTDPLDDSSFVFTLDTNFCSDWNGFLGLWNIAEFVNLSGSSRNITNTLYSISGVSQSMTDISVLPGAQTDLLVHDLPGFIADSYGKVCSNVTNGSAGDIDGRMVHYRNTAGGVEFAFAMPFGNGLSGPVFVPFNTFQPSLDPADANNFVANFVTVSNLDNNNAQAGTMYYYAQSGSVLGTEAATIPAGGRQDFIGHQFGTNLVGVIEWRPSSSTAKFQVRNIRYLYNDPIATSTGFDGAFQIEGIRGSNQQLYVPLDTRSGSSIVEIGNTQNTAINFTLDILNSSGVVQSSISQSLPAYGSVHIITDTLLPNAVGLARIAASGSGKLTATVMQYGRTGTQGVNYLYGINGIEPIGTVLRGSYNNFLSQTCRLLLINTAGTDQNVTLSMTRYDGTVVLTGQNVSIPANGIVENNICANDAVDTLGVVTVQATTPNSVIAHIVRYGAGEQYRFPTPVR